MIDDFAIGLTHLLLAIAAWRLMARADLDRDPPLDPESGAAAQPKPPRRSGRASQRV